MGKNHLLAKNYIIIKGAKENNLKNISLNIPKDQFVVITGLSGSGKSSLAFDTIYAEGQRRYLESLSSYTRQFLGGNEKPNVDSIEGLMPSISIDQKTKNHNPRSTVGTVTEIYDYLRILFARIGKPYCVNGHGLIKTLTIKQIVDAVFKNEQKTKLQILAPIIKQEKGTFRNKLIDLLQAGFLRVRIDGVIYSLEDDIDLDKNKKHSIELIIDRIVLNQDENTRSRIYTSIEKAIKQTNGEVLILADDKEEFYSLNHACDVCGFSLPELEPRLFSFNSPIGACSECNGLGFLNQPDFDKLIPDKNLSIEQGAIVYFLKANLYANTKNKAYEYTKFKALLNHFDIDIKKPIKDMSQDELDVIYYGSDDLIEYEIEWKDKKLKYQDYLDGLSGILKKHLYSEESHILQQKAREYFSEFPCKLCEGKKLNQSALSIKIGGLNIIDLTQKNILDLIEFFKTLELDEVDLTIGNLALKEINNRLNFLANVGLDYLNLSRSAISLSGGESQRIRLATQVGSALSGVLYVLDEPSIGLHQKDNEKLIATLRKMVELGNTLIVVEHDEDTILACDHLIDIGPKAGILGGEVVAQGTIEEVKKNKKSITANYLNGTYKIEVPKKRRNSSGKKLEVIGANLNNLKNINVSIPLNQLVAVTGVSGSGKSTLINQTLIEGINKMWMGIKDFNQNKDGFKEIKGIKHIDKLIQVSQDPIGRTPRSNPATYVQVFDDIRDLFAKTKSALAKGYDKGKFSFNIKGGRCENCSGDGMIKIEMHFLPDVYVKCKDCLGKRYNEETLSITYKNKNIYDVLEMNVSQALEFFYEIPEIKRKLELMSDVGLDYLQLGTPSTHLSGGEAQRIKLAKYLQKKPTGKTVYVLDEPTTGLHIHDIANLIEVLNRIVDQGDSVIVIEHNLDLIKVADYVIDLGPDGGNKGGEIVAYGTPEEVVEKKAVSYTGAFLEKMLNK